MPLRQISASLNIVNGLMQLVQMSLSELKMEGILKSYSFAYIINPNYIPTGHNLDMIAYMQESKHSGNVLGVVGAIVDKFAAFKKDSDVTFVSDSDWEAVGLGVAMGIEVGNANQALLTVPKEIKSADIHPEDGMRTSVESFSSGIVPVPMTPIHNVQQTGEGFVDFTELQSHKSNCYKEKKDEQPVCDDILQTDVHFNLGLQLLSDCEDPEDRDDDEDLRTSVRSSSLSYATKTSNDQADALHVEVHEDLCTSRHSTLSCGSKQAEEQNGPENHENCKDLENSASTQETKIPHSNIWPCCRKPVEEPDGSLHKCNARFWCQICGKTFNHKASLDEHNAKHTGNFKFSCNECNKLFASQWKLTAHMHTHREPRYSCNVCNKKFVRRSSCVDHERTHNMVDNYTCKQCGTHFKSPKYLKRHEKRHAQLGDQKCTLCGLLYKSKDALKIHMKRHQSLCTFYCPDARCKSTRGFLTREDLNRHVRAHNEKFLCAVCGKSFKHKHHMVDHEKSAHTVSLNQAVQAFKCQMCCKVFKQKRSLELHMRCHVQQPDFTCSICGKTFFRQDTFTNHVYLHSEQRLFTCAQCGKAFASKSNLSSHITKHNVRDQIKCRLCSATFKLKSSYEFHMQRHAGNYSFECFLCKKKFVRRCHFNDHMRTHDSSRPHVCPTCGKSYKEIKHCRAHVNRAHPNEFNLETLVASITPEDAQMAEILCSENVQNIGEMLPTNTISQNIGEMIPMNTISQNMGDIGDMLPMNAISQNIGDIADILSINAGSQNIGDILPTNTRSQIMGDMADMLFTNTGSANKQITFL